MKFIGHTEGRFGEVIAYLAQPWCVYDDGRVGQGMFDGDEY
jgi:hypothetical protein